MQVVSVPACCAVCRRLRVSVCQVHLWTANSADLELTNTQMAASSRASGSVGCRMGAGCLRARDPAADVLRIQLWVVRYTSGNVYEGEFRDGKMTGAGVVTYSRNGDKYEGQFLDAHMVTGAALRCAADLCVSMQHGDGTFTYKDGQKYIGQYQFNLKEGFGVWSSASTGTYTLADSICGVVASVVAFL